MRKPKIGQDVIVQWLDSGAGDRCLPKDACALKLARTHGQVVSCGPDPRLSLPRGWATDTLVLAMCSSGPEDVCSELAIIWVPTIVSLEVVS